MKTELEINAGNMSFDCRCGDDYFSLSFRTPVRALSSAVLNGGLSGISSFLNMKVDENFRGMKTDFPEPRETLAERAEYLGLDSPCAAMMTAASMESFTYAERRQGGVSVFCFLTSGLSNALAAGDPAEFMPRQMFSSTQSARYGTINIAAGTNISLSDSAAAEAFIVCTEAKSSVLFERGVKSIRSERTATGTGTDSLLVFSPQAAGRGEEYCGKHTKLGQLFAEAVREALSMSIDRYQPITSG
ncbi:MAG: adenosylcobinamide amidohydrolase [Spirochaetales bacterium]|nr:adenosylcobinamide amidohydrolase [Spirochaetales bacterium]